MIRILFASAAVLVLILVYTPSWAADYPNVEGTVSSPEW